MTTVDRSSAARTEPGSSSVSLYLLGQLPLLLVLGTDNGPAYVGDRVCRRIEAHRGVHLLNLHRTRRHNARMEQAIGELKAESGIRSGVELLDPYRALRRQEEAHARLDDLRARPCLEGRSAFAVDATMPSSYTDADRAVFYD